MLSLADNANSLTEEVVLTLVIRLIVSLYLAVTLLLIVTMFESKLSARVIRVAILDVVESAGVRTSNQEVSFQYCS